MALQTDRKVKGIAGEQRQAAFWAMPIILVPPHTDKAGEVSRGPVAEGHGSLRPVCVHECQDQASDTNQCIGPGATEKVGTVADRSILESPHRPVSTLASCSQGRIQD